MEIRHQWMEGSPEQCSAPWSAAPGSLWTSFGGIWYLATLGGGLRGRRSTIAARDELMFERLSFSSCCYSFKLHVRRTHSMMPS